MRIAAIFLFWAIGAIEAQENPASLHPSPAQLPRARIGVRYLVTFTPSPAQAYQWTISGSAPGLEFSGGDYARNLSGVPLQAGSFPITVRFERICGPDSAPPCRSVTSETAYTLQVGGSVAILNTALPDGRTGAGYFAVLQQSGGTGAISWSAIGLPPGLVLRHEASAGAVLAGRPTRAGIYAVMLRLHDGTGESATRTLPLVVTSSGAPSVPPGDRPAVVTDSLLPEASVGAPYEASLAARGGSPPHRFALRSSTLPPGLAMNELGRISGTPLRQGAFQFDVAATDAAGIASPAKTFLVDVFGAVRLQTSDLPPAIERRAYSAHLRAAGGVKPYEWSAVGLPGGLRVVPSLADLSSAEIIGTPEGPTGTGGAQVAVDVRDRNGLSDRRLLRLVVTDTTLRVVTATLPRGTTGQFYSHSLAIAGGAPPYACSLAPSVGVPPDLRLSPNGCVLSGLPRIAANQIIEIIARDSAGTTARARLPLIIESPDLRIITNPLPQTTEGTPLASFQLQAEGGSGQYIWSATGLPGGMRVSPEGVLSGTPIAAGTVDVVTVTVADRNRRDDVRSQVFSMTVRPRGSVTILTPAGLGTALLDQPFRQPLTATGGRVPYRWTLAAAAPAQPVATLPPGLFLDADTGAITGRPFQAGIYQFLVRAADIEGEGDVREFDLIVDLPLEVRVTEQPDFLVTGEAGRVQLQASASDPSRIEYSLAADVAGVSIDRRTGLITVLAGQPGDLVIEAAASDGTQRTPVHIAIRVIEALIMRAALLPPGTVAELPADAPSALLPDLTATLNGGRTTQSIATDVSLELPTAPAATAPQLVAGSRAFEGSVEEGSIRWTGVSVDGTGPFGQTSLLFRNVPARLYAVDGVGFRQNVGVTMVAGPARASTAVAVVARKGIEFSLARGRIIIQELIRDAFRHSSSLSLSLPEGTLPAFDDSRIRVADGTIEVLQHDPAQFDRIEIGLITDPLAPPSFSLIEASFTGSDRRESLVFSSGALARHPARNRYGVPIAPGGLATVEFRDPVPIAEATITSDAPLPELGGLRLRVTDAQGSAHDAGLLSVSPREVLFVVPDAASSGLAAIVIESSTDGSALSQAVAPIASVAPGLFSADASGSGPARGRLVRFSGANETSTPLSFFDEAEGRWLHVRIEAPADGDRLFLRLDATSLRNRSEISRVHALAGVQPLTVVSAGQSTDAAFLDSILLEIPRSLHGAGVVEVRIAVDGVESNAVTIEH